MSIRSCRIPVAATLLLLLTSAALAQLQPRVRPTEWAQPVLGSSLKNWHQVDAKLFRSEQPNRKEMRMIEAFGITTVLNLRSLHSDDGEAKDTGLQLHRIRMKAGSLTVSQITEALKAIQASPGPVLVHCRYGSDRTGAVVAAYRIVFQEWPKAEAIDELTHGGFGFHDRMYENIPTLIQDTDWDLVREQLGLAEKKDAAAAQ